MTRPKPTPEQAAASASALAAADWTVHHAVPHALDHAGYSEQAAFVRELPTVEDRNGAVQALAALHGVIDRHHLADPLRRSLVYAGIVCAHASYSEAADAQAAAERCATTAITVGVADDQVAFVAHGGQADLVRSIWGLLDLD